MAGAEAGRLAFAKSCYTTPCSRYTPLSTRLTTPDLSMLSIVSATLLPAIPHGIDKSCAFTSEAVNVKLFLPHIKTAVYALVLPLTQ